MKMQNNKNKNRNNLKFKVFKNLILLHKIAKMKLTKD